VVGRARILLGRSDLGVDTAAFSAGLKGAVNTTNTAAGQIEGRLANMGSKLGSLGSGMAKSLAAGFVGGLAGGAFMQAVEQIPAAVRAIVASGAGLVDTAAKVGMTTTALQELHFAANQGGASIEDMDTALGVFAKNVGAASQGQGELLRVLQANNVALRDQAGQVRPASDLVRDYADIIRRAASEQERARLTSIAFGRSGADLANVFRDGSAGIDQAANAVHRLGAVIDDATLQRVAELDDRWEAFAITMESRVKSAVLNSVTWLDRQLTKVQQVGAAMDQFRKEQAGEALSPGAMIGAAAGDPKAGAKAAIMSGMNNGDSFQWGGADSWLGVEGNSNLPPPSGGNKKSELERQKEMAQARLEQLQESLLTEREAELNAYALRMTDLQDFYDQGLITKQAYAEMGLAIEEDHAAQMRELDKQTTAEAVRNAQVRMAALGVMADSVSSVLGSLFGESKAAAYAQTIIATAQAIMQTYAQLGGGPWAIAAAGAVAAAGAAQLATIARTTKEGSGGKPSATAGGVSAAPSGGDTQAGSSSTLFVQGISSSQLFTGDAVRDLAQRLIDYQRDGGKVVLA